MTVNAYLLIPDWHRRDRNFEGRYDYQKEIAYTETYVHETIAKYQSLGCDVIGISLGDLNDRSYNDIFEAIAENNYFIQLRQELAGLYVNIGNHELTYYKDNPFWTLMTEIESTKVKNLLTRVWQPRGRFPIVRVVDELVDGNVRFIFNHYGCPISKPPLDGKTNIGLFHTDLYAKEIHADMERKTGKTIFEHSPIYFDGSGVFHGYHYAILAHMHRFYGEYVYTDDNTGFQTNIQYTSTLGRTNHVEVDNNMLERDLPVFLVEDGNFIAKEHNYFELMNRESCVNEEVIVIKQTKRAVAKDSKSLANDYEPLADDPIENIRMGLKDYPAYLDLYEDLLNKPETELGRELHKKLEVLKWQ